MADEDENRMEQADEVEALESMYPDDFELLQGADEGGTQKPRFKISLLPTEPADEEVNYIGCVLEVVCPPHYPTDGTPELTVHPLEKLTEPQRLKLEKIAAEAAEENVGAPAVFMVIEAVREWLQENNEDPGDGSAFSEMMRRQRDSQRATTEAAAAEARAEEEARGDLTEAEVAAARRKAEGTACTDETFAAWNAAFMAEMAAQSEHTKTRSMKSGGEGDPEAYITGRQWFEQKMLAGTAFGAGGESEDEEDDNDEDGGGEGGEGGGSGGDGGVVGGGAAAASASGGGGGSGGAAKPAAVDVNAAVFLNAPADDDLDLDDFSDED